MKSEKNLVYNQITLWSPCVDIIIHEIPRKKNKTSSRYIKHKTNKFPQLNQKKKYFVSNCRCSMKNVKT